jgi:hypothetical protein
MVWLCLCLQAFKQLDKDGSGTICIDELAEACRWVEVEGLDCPAVAVLGPSAVTAFPSGSLWGPCLCYSNQEPS